MSDTLLIKNGIIATLGEQNRMLTGHAILCEDGLIKRIAPIASFGDYQGRTLDAAGKVVLPGFINAHMHFYSTFARGLGKAAPSANFNEVLKNLWWRLDKQLTLDDCYYSALVPCIQAIRNGTTTIIDHHASPGVVRGSLDRIAKAVGQTGLRACLCYEVSDRDGPGIAQEGLEENAAFIRRNLAEKNPMLSALFGAHAAFTLSDSTLDRIGQTMSDLDAGCHIHTAEAASDEAYNVTNHGQRVVERLHKHGILGPKTIAAHCVHVDEAEMDLLASTGTAVAHNPQSNQNNAVGIANIVRMAEKGIAVGLGTDAMTVNMLEEVRVALWAQHLRADNPSVGFMEVASALTLNNARIANRYFSPSVGVLREGYAADIVLMDYDPITPFDEGTFLGHLIFGLSQAAVDTTIVAGRVLMEGKQLTLDLDEAEVAAKCRELAGALWGRF